MSTLAALIFCSAADRQIREVHHWVNGQILTGTSGRFGDVYNPASGEVQAKVALATPAEVDMAVAAAQRIPGLVRATASPQSPRALPLSRNL